MYLIFILFKFDLKLIVLVIHISISGELTENVKGLVQGTRKYVAGARALVTRGCLATTA